MITAKLSSKTLRRAADSYGDLSSAAIARRAGVSQSTLSRLLSGATTPSIATLVALSHIYCVSLDDLVEVVRAAR